MTDSLVVQGSTGDPLSALIAKRQLINKVMQTVMQRGSDYDTIPGCGPKPVLLKAGAEKLCSTFSLAPEFTVDDLGENGSRRFRVTCRMLTSSGTFCGEGVGECSSDEEKYAWKSARKAEWDTTPEDKRREKIRKDGPELQIRVNPADVANTCLKMAKKRALVDACLTVTAASDLFTQDIEEFNAGTEETKIAPPVRKAEATVSKMEIVPPPAPAAPAPVAEPPAEAPAAPATTKMKTVEVIVGIAEITRKKQYPTAKEGEPKPEPKPFATVKYSIGEEYYEASCWEVGVIKALENARDAGLFCNVTMMERSDGKRKIVGAVPCETATKLADAIQGGK